MEPLLEKLIKTTPLVRKKLSTLLINTSGNDSTEGLCNRLKLLLLHGSFEKAEFILTWLGRFAPEVGGEAVNILLCSTNEKRFKLGNQYSRKIRKKVDGFKKVTIADIKRETDHSTLIRHLVYGSSPERILAARRLGELKIIKRDVINSLVYSIKSDPDPEVVSAAFLSLLSISPGDIFKDIDGLFSNMPEYIIEELTDIIARKGGEAGIDFLIRIIDESHGELVELSARSLSRWQFEKSFQKILPKTKSVISRSNAIWLIGLLGKHHPPDLVSLHEKNLTRCIEVIKPFLEDPTELTRHYSLVALKNLGYHDWRKVTRKLTADSSALVREQAVEFLFESLSLDDADIFIKRLSDPAGAGEKIRSISLAAILKLDNKKRTLLRKGLVPMLKSRNWLLRQEAVMILGHHGTEQDVSSLEARLKDNDDDVRLAAFEAILKIVPSQRKDYAEELLTDADKNISIAALKELKNILPSNELVNLALQKLKKAKGHSGPMLFGFIWKNKTIETKEEILHAGLKSRNPYVRLKCVSILKKRSKKSDVPILRKLLTDRYDDVREKTYDSLCSIVPEEKKSLSIKMLADRSPRIRKQGLDFLKCEIDPALVDEILPLARDEVAVIRREAIKFLAGWDDRRIISELVSSLNDVNEQVRKTARKILTDPSVVPSLGFLSLYHGKGIGWRYIHKVVNEINMWASKIGQELLGVPVKVFNYRQGLGRTTVNRKKREISIEVSDTPVTSNHLYGAEIMKGLALHEIGHHLYDIGTKGHMTMGGIARSEGIGEIYDILRDEMLERAMRSRRPEWGVYFDRLASYAFAQDIHTFALDAFAKLAEMSVEEARLAINQGLLPGKLFTDTETTAEEKVLLSDSDMLVVPNLVPIQTAFLVCLRCGFDPRKHPDPRVAEAISLIPANLKDMEHREILETARNIGDLLGRSDKYKKELTRFQKLLRQHRKILRSWDKALDKLAESSQIPGWMPKGAVGIRKNSTPSIESSPQKLRDRDKFPGGQFLNLGKELNFPKLENEKKLPFNPAGHAKLVAAVRKHVRMLRAYFERMGIRSVDEYASRRGRRLDLAQARYSAIKGSPDFLVHSWEEQAPDMYLGVLIDRSSSMAGEKIKRAKSFGVLVSESLKGLHGIDGHINAFDDDTFYRLGEFKRNSIASLKSGGGNNDSGALARAVELAFESRKRNKLIIMISDGSPTRCTFESLKNLVQKLTRDNGVVCAQVAVEKMHKIAFPHYVDLSKYKMDEAIARFGKMLIRLTAAWR